MKLNIRQANATKSYVVTDVCSTRPRIAIKNGNNVSYLPLTTSSASGFGLRNKVNGSNYRPLEYQSMSTSATYYTSAVASNGLSSTTALTRSSTSQTVYHTCSSTSGTSYLTRSSTSGTSYLTALDTMLLIQESVKSTYFTQGTYNNATWYTGDGYRATSVFPQYVYSLSNSNNWPRLGAMSVNYPAQNYGYTFSEVTGPQSGQYQASFSERVSLWQTFYNGAYYQYKTSDLFWSQSGSYTSSFRQYNGYTLQTQGSFTSTSNRVTNFSNIGSSGQIYFSVIASTAVTSNAYMWSATLQQQLASAVLANMVNYSSNSTFKTTFSASTYEYVTWGDGKYNQATAYTTLSFGRATKTTATSYLTRSSTSATSYLTRSSTSRTEYKTRASTSGYSGVSSSSSQSSGWL